MRKLLGIFCLAMACVLAGAPVLADTIPAGDLFIDFRLSGWGSANNQPTFTLGGVTATALPSGSELYQDTTDGLGILGGEPDEVDLDEQLQISFANPPAPIYLTGVWLTDLFQPDDGGGLGESGEVVFSGTGESFTFAGHHPENVDNGEFYLSFGKSLLVTINDFFTFNTIESEINNDFSVAGFTGSEVPVPAAVWLLGSGLLGLVGLRRFRKS